MHACRFAKFRAFFCKNLPLLLIGSLDLMIGKQQCEWMYNCSYMYETNDKHNFYEMT